MRICAEGAQPGGLARMIPLNPNAQACDSNQRHRIAPPEGWAWKPQPRRLTRVMNDHTNVVYAGEPRVTEILLFYSAS